MLRAATPFVVLGLLSTQAFGDVGISNEPVKPRLELRYGPNKPAVAPEALSGHTIFLNRCVGGCDIVPGDDNAAADPIVSGIADSAVTLAEATDIAAEWPAIVQCVKEVYSPFNVTITDQRPTAVASYSQIVVGGTNADKGVPKLGLSPGTGGIAIVSGNCSPIIKGVSYAFADNDNVNIFAREALGNTSTEARVLGMCWIIAQETAHSFGLDHQFEYADDKTSACNDPMTYEADCGGQKFYRNRFASCGVSGGIDGDLPGPRACKCGGTQNSHLKLAGLFGAGTSLIPAPTAAITMPTASTAANSLGTQVLGTAGSKRGVGRVELYINGYKWAEVKGAAFGRAGQPNPAQYQLLVPANVPDSIVDVQLKAYDDLELVGESPVVTAVKGKAGGCTAASECAEGQKCEAGKCFWDPATGNVGDPCTFPQACLSGRCSDDVVQGDGICTQSCVVGLADACPAGLECVQVGNDSICYTPSDDGGCCSTGGGSPLGAFVLAGFVLGFIALRRKK